MDILSGEVSDIKEYMFSGLSGAITGAISGGINLLKLGKFAKYGLEAAEGFITGAIENVSYQMLVEDKDFDDINVGQVAVSSAKNGGAAVVVPFIGKIPLVSKLTKKLAGKVDDLAKKFGGKVDDIPPNFVGKLRGKDVELPNVKMSNVEYVKRDPAECKKFRDSFNKSGRKDFINNFSETHINELKDMGFSDVDIIKLNDGLVPSGYQVHHKLPLDDGGTNDVSNLVLIKNEPYHKVITNYQKSSTSGLKAGETANIDWPIPTGDFYNG